MGWDGSDHCRLLHFGWEQFWHGPVTRPRESTVVGALLGLLVYPDGSAAMLFAGTSRLSFLSCLLW